MAKMNTSHRYIFDAAPATLFRGRDAVAITASAESDEVTLDEVLGYWTDANELADETLAIVINVEAADATTGDETYTLVATCGADGAGGNDLNAIEVGTVEVEGPGQYVLLVDVPTVKLQYAAANTIGISATLAGTTPSLTYAAFMTQIKA